MAPAPAPAATGPCSDGRTVGWQQQRQRSHGAATAQRAAARATVEGGRRRRASGGRAAQGRAGQGRAEQGGGTPRAARRCDEAGAPWAGSTPRRVVASHRPTAAPLGGGRQGARGRGVSIIDIESAAPWAPGPGSVRRPRTAPTWRWEGCQPDRRFVRCTTLSQMSGASQHHCSRSHARTRAHAAPRPPGGKKEGAE